MDNKDKITLGMFLISIAVVVLVSTYTFFIKRDYNFLIEAECDPDVQRCFFRECSENEECPTNGLSNFRVFIINAGDFEKCSNNSCLNECTTGTIACKEIHCDASNGDVCNPAI